METLKIIKIGGDIIDDAKKLHKFLMHFSQIQGLKILVHGGGKSASNLTQKMGVKVKLINGRRVTDEETLDIIIMVYAGRINKKIVSDLQAIQCNAIGLSGADCNSISSIKRPVKEFDFGFVGDIVNVNTYSLKVLLKNRMVPVFCAITHDNSGQLLNTNADTIASELAIGFSNDYSVQLYYCLEKNGVLMDVDDDLSVIEKINTASYQELKANHIVTDGMLPKLDNCFHAVDNSVKKVCIGNPEMLFEANSKFTTITK